MFKLRSGFIVGGLIGAAAAMVWARRRPAAAARLTEAVSGMGSRLAGWAVSGWVNRSWDKAADAVPKPSSDTEANSKSNLNKIEAILNSDPALKQEVSRIREEASDVH
ncbi:hypothetical protein ACFSL6_16725 [Paenibacillus thailandensis]|uniref:YtxH domain-containing protein n=1 Tax=Paenibacillus thailandensis TaxID=393250 RepID=A0ABW5R0I8_9BACL